MLVKVENCRSLRIWNVYFLRCHMSLLQYWGCSGEFMAQFHTVQASASLLKSSKKDPVSASWIIGADFWGGTEMHQIPSHPSGETWPGCAQGAEGSVSWISILELAWDSFSPFLSESQNLRSSHSHPHCSELQLHLFSSCHPMRSSHATGIGQKSWKFPSKHAARWIKMFLTNVLFLAKLNRVVCECPALPSAVRRFCFRFRPCQRVSWLHLKIKRLFRHYSPQRVWNQRILSWIQIPDKKGFVGRVTNGTDYC